MPEMDESGEVWYGNLLGCSITMVRHRSKARCRGYCTSTCSGTRVCRNCRLLCFGAGVVYWLRNKTKNPGFLNIGKGDKALNNRYDKFFSNPGIDVPFGRKTSAPRKASNTEKKMAAQKHPDATALHPSRPTPQNSKLKSPAGQHDIVSQTDQRTTTKLH